MCIYVEIYAGEYRHPEMPEVSDSSGAGVTGGREPPGKGARILTDSGHLQEQLMLLIAKPVVGWLVGLHMRPVLEPWGVYGVQPNLFSLISCISRIELSLSACSASADWISWDGELAWHPWELEARTV